MVESNIVLFYLRSRVWGIIHAVGPSVVTVQTPRRPFPCDGSGMSYPVFMPKLSTHRMHDPGSNVPYIWPKVLTDNQKS
jgi:hypothetical protein